MSRHVEGWEYDDDSFEFGDIVEFDAPSGSRLQGEIVRIYNARIHYHVKVDGLGRYSIDITSDNVKLIRRAGE